VKVSVAANLGYQPSAAKVPEQRQGSFGAICCHQAAGLTSALQEKQEELAVAASSGAPCLHGPAIQAFFSETSSVAVSQPHKIAMPAEFAMNSSGRGSNTNLRSSASVPPALPILRERLLGSSAETLELLEKPTVLEAKLSHPAPVASSGGALAAKKST